MTDHADVIREAREWLESLRGTEWVSTEEGGRTWKVGELARALLDEWDALVAERRERNRAQADLAAAHLGQGEAEAENARLRERLAEADEIIDDCWHQFAIDLKGKLWAGGLSTLEMVDDYRNMRDGEALSASEREETREVGWLIERGQAENHDPTVWWISGPSLSSRDGETWTQNASEATRFATRDEADEVVERLFRHRRHLLARATEHMWASASEREETPNSPDADDGFYSEFVISEEREETA